MKPVITAEYEFTVPFYDLDPLGICWHGNYVKYFEDARRVLLRKIDFDYTQMRESGYYWPVIDLNVRYVNALKYDQHAVVEAALVEYENYLKIRYKITERDSGDRITKGSTTQVAVSLDTHEMQIVSPAVLTDRIAAYLK